MKRLSTLCLAAAISGPATAVSLSGNVAGELQLFRQDARFSEQLDQNLTLSFKPRLRHDWNNRNDELTLELYLRLDDRNEERQHADIREFKWLHVAGSHEWRVGIDTVFWGVTESQHLVDVINQIDRLEGLDGEDKLGQPMIRYSTVQDWGALDLFLLTGFREASFHSSTGRLRLPLSVDKSRTGYESSDKERQIDLALRYTRNLGDTEFGLSLFDGTNRDPALSLDTSSGQLIPYYSQMTQFGLDLQSIIGDWIWKLEFIHRDTDPETYSAITTGFEYTFYALFDSAIDLGSLLEYSWEGRDQNAGVFDNDLFAGLRLAFNDVQSSELLAGLLIDTDNHSQSIRIEASRRLGDSWKLSAELQAFTSIAVDDPLAAFANDDYVLIELARYF